MYNRNLDTSLSLSSHLFPDYHNQNEKVMLPNVILTSLINSEYNKPFHPYMVVSREDYYGTVLQTELFVTEEEMIDCYYKTDKFNPNKTYFYCYREDFIAWILQYGYNLDPKLVMLASLSKYERLVYQLQENIDAFNSKRTFYVKNFVNAGLSFYHIVTLTKELKVNDSVLIQSILEFANYAISKINSVSYANQQLVLEGLNEVITELGFGIYES